jgi:5'-AMP-activated protein kinase catalytic alpha subunit
MIYLLDKTLQMADNEKKYIILKTLGKGSFGKVKEALHVKSGEKIAIKILEKERIKKKEDLVRIKREIDILKKVRHPNIIQLYEVSFGFQNTKP